MLPLLRIRDLYITPKKREKTRKFRLFTLIGTLAAACLNAFHRFFMRGLAGNASARPCQ
jgi:hypothetical protein